MARHALWLISMLASAATLALGRDIKCSTFDDSPPETCKQVCTARGYEIGYCDFGICACAHYYGPSEEVKGDVDVDVEVPAEPQEPVVGEIRDADDNVVDPKIQEQFLEDLPNFVWDFDL